MLVFTLLYFIFVVINWKYRSAQPLQKPLRNQPLHVSLAHVELAVFRKIDRSATSTSVYIYIYTPIGMADTHPYSV